MQSKNYETPKMTKLVQQCQLKSLLTQNNMYVRKKNSNSIIISLPAASQNKTFSFFYLVKH